MSQKKVCSKCGAELPATTEYFHAQEHGKYGLRGMCKRCTLAYHRSTKGKEIQARAAKKYMANSDHRERARAIDRKYKSKLETRAQRRAYREANKERIAESERRAKANPESRARENARRRAKYATPEGRAKAIAQVNKRRALKKASAEHYTEKDVMLQMKAQTDRNKVLRCWWCGKPLNPDDYHIDHVIPLDKGGSNGPKNIVLSHPRCNLKKQNKLPSQFAGRLF